MLLTVAVTSTRRRARYRRGHRPFPDIADTPRRTARQSSGRHTVPVVTSNRQVVFGLGLEACTHQVSELLRHARIADDAGIDFVSVGDHPYFGDRLDGYAALGFVLGTTSNVSGAVIMTNLLNRPAPVLARTLTGLSDVSGGRVILGLGATGMPQDRTALGLPDLSSGARMRAMEEAIKVVRVLSGGGDPVTFDGEFYKVVDLPPAAAPTPPVWVGVGGRKGLAITGRNADGWVPPHGADWRTKLVAEGRPIIEEAAVSAGRSPDDVGTFYILSGRIGGDPLSESRDHDGLWIGGSVAQWIEELTFAVLERNASGFQYMVRPGETMSDDTVNLWAREVVPAAREAIAKG